MLLAPAMYGNYDAVVFISEYRYWFAMLFIASLHNPGKNNMDVFFISQQSITYLDLNSHDHDHRP